MYRKESYTMKYNRIKKTLCLIAALAIIPAFAVGCSSEKSESQSSETEATTTAVATKDEAKVGKPAVSALEDMGIVPSTVGINPSVNYDDNKVGFQLDAPKDGDTIAVMHTSKGDIRLRLFAEQAPKTVTSFINLAKEGKYNNTIFHRVIKDFMIQGGDYENANGTGGTSSYGESFEDEFCDKLFNIRGAVAMANSGPDTNGSQFFINQTTPEAYKSNGGFQAFENQWTNIKAQLENYKDSELFSAFVQQYGTYCYNTDVISDEIKKLYDENGGNPYLDGAYNAVDRGHTVFAQVIDGMDVVDAIADVSVDSTSSKPTEDVIITSVEITTYSAE